MATLLNTARLPHEVLPVLQTHVQILVDALGERLTGVYVHGSVAMGGFTPAQSDLDYLAVVDDPLSAAERVQLSASFLAVYGQGAPANGVEMSIVEARYTGPGFRYPTPYEFHMGTREQVRQHGLPHTAEMVDPDLAAHFTITYRRGICVYGKPIDQVFTAVPRADYLDSIALDAEDCAQNILEHTGAARVPVPRYAVLNFCRVLALIEADLVTSKVEGATWGLAYLPEHYHPLIEAALQEYRAPGSAAEVDDALLKAFARYALQIIRG